MLSLQPIAASSTLSVGGGWHLFRCLMLSILVLGLASSAIDAGEIAPIPQVNQFIPQGTVKRIRQASARFSEAMVAFGDPRSPVAPFDRWPLNPGLRPQCGVGHRRRPGVHSRP
jgi:hypothetical protein